MYREIGVASLAIFSEMLAAAHKSDIAPGPGGSRITPIGTAWGGTASVVALYPSSQIVAHADPPIATTRHHVPLVLNDGCWVFHDGAWQQLEIGHIYAMNPAQTHGAVNWGSERRLHLILDGDASCLCTK